jgi:acyl-coenzyme A synthetase/AMP-(fatty) acid ligase
LLEQLRGVVPLLRGYGVHLGDLTAVLARRYGDRTAVVGGGLPGAPGNVSHAALESVVARLATAHRDRGVGEGDVVLVRLADDLDAFVHVLALARLGAVPLLVDVRIRPEVVERLERDAGAVDRLTDGEARTVADRVGDAGVEEADRDPDAAVLIVATPGTADQPRGVTLTSHGLLSAVGRLAVAPVGWRSGVRAHRDLLLSELPVTNVTGLSVVLSALCAGIPLCLRVGGGPVSVLDAIDERRPNVVAAMPALYAAREASGAADRDLTTVQLWISTGDTMPATRARRFQSLGAAGLIGDRGLGTAAFADIFGVAELSGPAAVRLHPPSLIRPMPSPPLSVTLPGVEVRAVWPDGEPVGWGQVGRLEFRGPGVLIGCLPDEDGDPATTSREDGWVQTGDVGKAWPGDLFSHVGRLVDRLHVDGTAVDPAPIEAQIRARRGVRDTLLVGVRDPGLGDRPVALLVKTDDWDGERFDRWAARALEPAHQPRTVIEVDRIPVGPDGRIDRAAGRALAERALGPVRDPAT